MQYRPHAVLIEDKASGQSLIQELRKGVELPDLPKKVLMPVVAIEPEGSKLTRAIRVSPQFESGRVWLPEYADWLIAYESELFGFPLSTNDDQVDSTSQYLDWAHNHSIEISSASTGRRASVDADNTGSGGERRRGRNRFGGYT